jgi:hypothetical protein
MSVPEDLLRGDVPLGKTYWLFGVVPGATFSVVGTYLDRQREFMAVPAAIGLLGIAYFPVICVAIWQSASKYQGPKWLAVLAKVVVVLSAIRFYTAVVTLPFGGLPAATP